MNPHPTAMLLIMPPIVQGLRIYGIVNVTMFDTGVSFNIGMLSGLDGLGPGMYFN
jgi:hypothetical protein